MNSIHFLPGLKEIKPLAIYITEQHFPGKAYEGFVPAITLDSYIFPQIEDVSDRILQVAAAVYDGQLPIKSQEPETVTELQELIESEEFSVVMTPEDSILNEIAKSILALPGYLIEQLAEGETWAMNLVNSCYAAWASQNAYVPGKEYLRMTLGDIDITPEGLNINGDNLSHHLRATHSNDIDEYFEPLWDIDLLVNDGSPMLAQGDLIRRVQEEQPVSSMPLQVKVLRNGMNYPTEQMVYLLPSAYLFSTRIKETKSISDLEQLMIIKRFLTGCDLADTEEASDFEELGTETFEDVSEEEEEVPEEKLTGGNRGAEQMGELLQLRKP